MHGPGTYVFPDESLLAAVWSRNRPVTRVVYKEPLGRKWTLESISDNVNIKDTDCDNIIFLCYTIIYRYFIKNDIFFV